MKKVLVTGAAGFIGCNMVKYLLDNTDYYIYGIDNLSGGRKNEKFVKDLECERFQFYESDFSISKELFQKVKFELVFHFAATPRVQYSVEHLIETNDNNVSKTLKLLDFCKETGVKRFVFSSSSSVYGDLVDFPTKETALKNPKSPYALQKSIIEEYCKIYSSIYGLDTVCLRYFNVYGPGQYAENSYATVICAWMKGFVENSKIRLDGNGLQSRDFSYVTDVCRANLIVGKSLIDFNGDVFNVACNDTTNLLQIFELMKKITGCEPEIEKNHFRVGDVKKTHADISKIKSLGFEDAICLNKGIELTYNWYKKINKNGKDTN
jgi:nucleoside-diphosphate-sugar epimerase